MLPRHITTNEQCLQKSTDSKIIPQRCTARTAIEVMLAALYQLDKQSGTRTNVVSTYTATYDKRVVMSQTEYPEFQDAIHELTRQPPQSIAKFNQTFPIANNRLNLWNSNSTQGKSFAPYNDYPSCRKLLTCNVLCIKSI